MKTKTVIVPPGKKPVKDPTTCQQVARRTREKKMPRQLLRTWTAKESLIYDPSYHVNFFFHTHTELVAKRFWDLILHHLLPTSGFVQILVVHVFWHIFRLFALAWYGWCTSCQVPRPSSELGNLTSVRVDVRYPSLPGLDNAVVQDCNTSKEAGQGATEVTHVPAHSP